MTFDSCYNLTKGGEGCIGFKHSQVFKERIASLNRGKIRSREMREKIRQANLARKFGGERNPNAKLTKYEVLYIRKIYGFLEVCPIAISEYFCMTRTSIMNIVKRKTWKDV